MGLFFKRIVFTLILLMCFGYLKIQAQQNQVVIILMQPKAVSKTIMIGRHQINFKQDDFRFVADSLSGSFNVDTTKLNDTLKIKSINEFVLFSHKFNALGFLDYIFKSGDTALIEIKNKRPWVTIKNRNVLPFDQNYDLLFRKKVMDSDLFSANEVLFFNKMRIDPYNNKPHDYTGADYLLAKKYFDLEKKFLDSVHTNKLMSKEVYDYFFQKITFDSYKAEVDNEKLNNEQMQMLAKQMETMPVSYRTKSGYDNLLEAISLKLFYKKEYLIKTKSGAFIDARKVYDDIERANFLSKKQKVALFKKELSSIVDGYPKSDFDRYADKYKKYSGDKSFVDQLASKYLLTYNNVDQKKALDMLTVDKKKVTLENVIKENKGKLIYIDFWASWCVPCRENMPASHKLREAYKNKKVVFVYLSTDRVFEDWNKAAKDENLSLYKHSYLSVNSANSDLLKKMKIVSIPRYAIFDANGNLIDANAPGPDSPLLKEIFDKHIPR